MGTLTIPAALVARLHGESGAARWGVSRDRLAKALQASADKAMPGTVAAREVATYLERLHLADLALACACADGSSDAWDHFVQEYRPVLYRAAEALAPGGGAREIADSIYAELFGLASGGARRSLFGYFHGRSSLATWLRAVLAQRHVDAIRRHRRIEPLVDEEAIAAPRSSRDPDRARWLVLMSSALGEAVAALAPRDRLRIDCYYRQSLTLAQIGALLGEHEATVSRQLARARQTIRRHVERDLQETHGLSGSAVTQCFASVVDDAGTLDLDELLNVDERKESALGRSK